MTTRLSISLLSLLLCPGLAFAQGTVTTQTVTRAPAPQTTVEHLAPGVDVHTVQAPAVEKTTTRTAVERPAVQTTVKTAPAPVPDVLPAITETETEFTPDRGRYQLEMLTERGVKNTRVPALILDTYRGIVWTCQNLQDGRPLWVKTDLGKNGDKPMNHSKYIVRMLERQERELRVPAVVLDTELGIVWNCPNIIDGNAMWIGKSLTEEYEGK